MYYRLVFAFVFRDGVLGLYSAVMGGGGRVEWVGLRGFSSPVGDLYWPKEGGYHLSGGPFY